ncbi:MAG: branched-chain amino acid ABC transporter substrate-binding protein [Coriobacteriia bacterium]|nr:branched-chain amino acid ABC transporter substrate-binding protein [Coriobacteriia bacterium]
MKVRNRRLLAIMAALVAVSMIATGCGGGETTDTGEEPAAEAMAIKIGIGAPLTQGAVALGQGMKRGAGLAISQANESAEAKELGITFQAVDGDDQGDPKTGVTVANTFASDPNLVGVMGHLNSGVSIPASKVYQDNKIVMVSPASTNPALTLQGFSAVNRVCATDDVQGPVGAESAFGKLGFKSVVVIDDSTPYGEGLAAEFAKKFEELGGKVLFTEKTSDKDSDFNALVTKIKAANPDLIYYGGIYNAGAILAKQASDAGVKAPLMGGDGLYDGEYINLAGAEQAEGDFCTSIGLPVDKLPKGQEFSAAYKALFPNDEIAAYDAYSYDAANVIIAATLAVAKEMGADAVTSPEGRDAIIAAVRGFSGEGVTGPISFDENGDTTNKAITTYKVVSGAWAAEILPE